MKGLGFFQKIMFVLNLFFSCVLLLSCSIPYTSSASLAFISLAVPFLFLINGMFFLYWFVQKKFLILMLPLFILAYGYHTLGTFIVFNESTLVDKDEDHLSIMSFNSLGFQGKESESYRENSDSIMQFIKQENPAIICFQEFDRRKIRGDDFKDYPFKYVDFEFGTSSNRVVQAIYSKYRIIKKGLLEFPDSFNSAVFADVLIKNDTVRIYNLHLQSLRIRPSSIKKEDSDKLFARLRYLFAKQQEQSKIVRKHMNESPYRNIVCGDFNNNQFSNAYFTIKGDLRDSFLEKGYGYGKTINFWKFPFRIDFILVDPSIEVLSHTNYVKNLSDHEPIMVSIKIGTDE